MIALREKPPIILSSKGISFPILSKCNQIFISKAITSTETPVKEKHARRIILGTHREKGAFTFWSYALGFPLASSSILSWKFCHVLHKVLRDGHRNVLQDCMRHHSSLVEVGKQWGHLHDRYGQLVAIYTKLLCTKMEFHAKHADIPPNLEVTDEVLELSLCLIVELNTSIAISTLTSGQCRLAPLIQVIQDCSHLYHFTVKLLFKLHACLPADTLQGHRDRFREQFQSLKSFFNKARDMLYFKRLIQIPRLPDSPPNFLHAASLAKHVKPVVVIPDEDEPEPLDLQTVALMTGELIFSSVSPSVCDHAVIMEFLTYRDLQIESLKRDLELLRAELERVKAEAQRYITQLKSQINSLEAEVEEQRAQKQHALMENEQLRMELEATRRRNAEHETFVLHRICAEKAQATEQRYNKLKEKHTELVASHAELLRQSADTVKMLSATQQTQEEVERTKHQLTFEINRIKQESDMKVTVNQGCEEQMKKKLLEEQFALLQGTITEAENIIQDAVAKLDDPLHVRCTSSPDYLISRAEATLGSIDKVKKGHADYLSNMGDAAGLLRALTQFSHLASDTIVNGSATAHMAPTDHADRLTENCRDCASQSLQYLKDLKSKATLQKADPAAIRAAVQKILRLGQDLRPKGRDIGQEELGDLVDKEMAATSAAIEEAVRRIDEMMNQARKDTSGVKLEVNERSLTLLLLFQGAASIREFYAKNSRWTEGLISASKAVGWGATELVESADKVVLHTGKYEELIVCSHEIAASTAQLVAASKVKADRNSKKLTVLQQASRHVNEMAAKVVGSTRTGQENLEEKDAMDFSGMSLIKLKKEEIESQVKVLELESQLENERMRLGELRKQHYGLAGVPLVDVLDANSGTSSPNNSASMSPNLNKPALRKKPVLEVSEGVTPPTGL
uniref:Huntingtin interacting protein 1 related n=1 Tax=Gouania willdenowi TaxID=441366 RepID=A0A8C5E4E2_GOUWI